MSRWGSFLSAVLSVIAFDRLTKILAVNMLAEGRSLPVLPDMFHLTLVFNTGAAFGLLRGQRLFFTVISILAVLFIVYYILKNKAAGSISLIALGLIAGGALGNLFDRMRYGQVIDFLDLRIWPVFNIADSAITVGAAILIVRMLIGSYNINK